MIDGEQPAGPKEHLSMGNRANDGKLNNLFIVIFFISDFSSLSLWSEQMSSFTTSKSQKYEDRDHRHPPTGETWWSWVKRTINRRSADRLLPSLIFAFVHLAPAAHDPPDLKCSIVISSQVLVTLSVCAVFSSPT